MSMKTKDKDKMSGDGVGAALVAARGPGTHEGSPYKNGYLLQTKDLTIS